MSVLVAEFDSPEGMLAALRRLEGMRAGELETYSPWPVPGVDDALGLPSATGKVARNVLIAGILGAITAYGIQWWCNAHDYVLNVGGRPAHAWPAFVLITFETMVLFAGFAAFLSVFAYAGLPRPWHPLFEVEGFERATIDRFFVVVSRREAPLDEIAIRREMTACGALRVVGAEEA